MRKKRKKKINFDKIIKNRFIGFFVISLVFFGVLTLQLLNVMVREKDKHTKELDALTFNTISGTSSPRGRIYDRNYKILVDNKSLKTITYQKQKGVTNKEMIALANLISSHITVPYEKLTDRNKREYFFAKEKKYCDALVSKEEIEKVEQRKMTQRELDELKIKRIPEEKLAFSEEEMKVAYLFYLMNKGYTYEEKIIKSDATDEEYAYVSEHLKELSGFNTNIDWERVYPYGDSLKSILGTVSTSSQGIPAENKEYYLERGYSLNDRVGLSYIEKQYEEYLHGEKPVYEVINSHDTKLVKEGKRGKDIVLTIDIDLQQAIERILDDQIRRTKNEPNTEFYDHTNVIIQDPRTGEILAMSGRKIVNGQMVDDTISILTSPVTPGSIVKGASILVGYNTGAIHIGERMLDECVKVAGVAEKCSSVSTLGVIDDIKALSHSSNVYQFKTAIRVNGQEYHRDMKMPFNQQAFDTYRAMYHSFGLGVKTGIDLPVESSGYTSKDKAAGNLLDYSIGQYESYTPMQISQYITTIANGGDRLRPHLLKEVHSSSETDEIGALEFTVEKEVLNKVDTKPEYMARMKAGFWAVMNAPGGYGVGFVDQSFSPSGKTGTSQSMKDTDGDGRNDTETISSAFIGYLPTYSPKMSITITSPHSAHPNSNIDYMTWVNMRISKEVTYQYVSMYGLD